MAAGIVWLFLILAAAGGYIMFDGMVLLAAACFLVLLGTALVLSLLWQRHSIRAGFETDVRTARRNEDVQSVLFLRSRSFLPAKRIRVRMEIGESGREKRTVKRETVLSMEGGAEAAVYCRVPSEHCRIQEVRVREIRLYDILQIFSVRLPVPKPQRIGILPEIRPLCAELTEGEETAGNGEGGSGMRKGGASFESGQIREYQPGDTMCQIDWKQSARTDRLMVREYGEVPEKTKRILLFLDADSEKSGDNQDWNDRRDGWMTAAVSLAGALTEAGAQVQAVWLDGAGEHRMPAGSRKELDELAFALAGSDSFGAKGSGPVPEQGERVLRLDFSGTLWDENRRLAGLPGADAGKDAWEQVRVIL